jgi:hypothetical protein
MTGRLSARQRLVSAVILTAGFATALLIHVTAAPVPANPLGRAPEDSKQYLREMEVYGGKANVLASQFRQWLESLGHGRRLAVTVACLTPFVALLYLIASTPLPPAADEAPPGGRKPEGESRS